MQRVVKFPEKNVVDVTLQVLQRNEFFAQCYTGNTYW